MTGSEPQPDYCPRCGSALEIVSVKFRFGRTAIVAACPNCALEFAEEGRVARSKAIAESGKIAETARGLLRLTEAAMHRLAKRLRYIFAVLFAAVSRQQRYATAFMSMAGSLAKKFAETRCSRSCVLWQQLSSFD